jgi:hypothetical protein
MSAARGRASQRTLKRASGWPKNDLQPRRSAGSISEKTSFRRGRGGGRDEQESDRLQGVPFSGRAARGRDRGRPRDARPPTASLTALPWPPCPDSSRCPPSARYGPRPDLARPWTGASTGSCSWPRFHARSSRPNPVRDSIDSPRPPHARRRRHRRASRRRWPSRAGVASGA